jgi:hypothetical protein
VAAALGGGGEPRLQRLPALRLAFDCTTPSRADEEHGRLGICPTIGWFLYSAVRLFRLADDEARTLCFLVDDGLVLTRMCLPLIAVRCCPARVTVGVLEAALSPALRSGGGWCTARGLQAAPVPNLQHPAWRPAPLGGVRRVPHTWRPCRPRLAAACEPRSVNARRATECLR